MLSDLADGARDAILVYHVDRLTRRPIELEQFLDVLTAAKVRQVRFVAGGDLDIGNGDGLVVLRMLLAVAANESATKSRRVKRKMEQNAAAGLPHGGYRRPFGYADDKITTSGGGPSRTPTLRALLSSARIAATTPSSARHPRRTNSGPGTGCSRSGGSDIGATARSADGLPGAAVPVSSTRTRSRTSTSVTCSGTPCSAQDRATHACSCSSLSRPLRTGTDAHASATFAASTTSTAAQTVPARAASTGAVTSATMTSHSCPKSCPEARARTVQACPTFDAPLPTWLRARQARMPEPLSGLLLAGMAPPSATDARVVRAGGGPVPAPPCRSG